MLEFLTSPRGSGFFFQAENSDAPTHYFGNNDHLRQIAPGLSQKSRADAAAQAELRQVEGQVDVTAVKLWGLTDDELAEIRRSLKELG